MHFVPVAGAENEHSSRRLREKPGDARPNTSTIVQSVRKRKPPEAHGLFASRRKECQPSADFVVCSCMQTNETNETNDRPIVWMTMAMAVTAHERWRCEQIGWKRMKDNNNNNNALLFLWLSRFHLHSHDRWIEVRKYG